MSSAECRMSNKNPFDILHSTLDIQFDILHSTFDIKNYSSLKLLLIQPPPTTSSPS